jgi:hypothetical protein
MALKSSQKLSHQVLVLGVMSASRVERVLRDWANLPGLFRGRGSKSLPVVFGQKPEDVEAALRRMVKHYPEFFLQQGLPMPERQAFDLLALIAQLLRMAWDSPNLRKREWYLADIEGFYHRALNRFGDPPTQALPLETLVYHFRRNSERALHCPNPECPAPYFFRQKKGQIHCSPECADAARCASKRRWWNENRAKAR